MYNKASKTTTQYFLKQNEVNKTWKIIRWVSTMRGNKVVQEKKSTRFKKLPNKEVAEDLLFRLEKRMIK